MEKVAFLGTTTLKRMLSAVYDEDDPLYNRNTFSECFYASVSVGKNPGEGDETVYVYYHSKLNETIMTTVEGDTNGFMGSSAGFSGKVEL